MRWLLIGAAVFMGGCQGGGDLYLSPDKNPAIKPAGNGMPLQSPAAGEVTEVVAGKGAVTVDGELTEAVWTRARSYPLAVAWRVNAIRQGLQEGGSVKFAWDEKYLYVAGELTDLDVVAEGDQDNALSYSTSDALELFLKPRGEGRYYWEIYATPNSRKTVYLNPSRGRTYMASKVRRNAGVEVKARVKGTVNDWSDRDGGWTVEMAVPWAELGARGDGFKSEWLVLVGRYNHSAYHEVMGGELSTVPTVQSADFHYHELWARLRLEQGN